MTFRIADTFTDSLARLTGDEQKAVKITAFELQMNPANPGLQFHKLERVKDKRFCSVRVSRDIRMIVHRTEASLLLCYVDHHDDAYQWAERRRLETHPKTGAAQFVKIRETVQKIKVPTYVPAEPQPAESKPTPVEKRYPFKDVSDDDLLKYGVPEDWLADVKAADEVGWIGLADHLPSEASEALMLLAIGETPVVPELVEKPADPFEHPDAKRRFQLVATSDELQRALDYPWDRWAVFLHPSQRDVVARQFNGPARVAGSAGTGKTVVAMHRAAAMAKRDAETKVLLTTFSRGLARLLRVKMRRLLGEELDGRVLVRSLDEVGLDVYEKAYGHAKVATAGMLRKIMDAASAAVGDHLFSVEFLLDEWADVVDAWQIDSWEGYRDVPRLGRRTRLGEKQRQKLWDIFEQVHERLRDGAVVTMPRVFATATEMVENGQAQVATHVVVDEAQDISVPQLRFLAAVAGEREDGLFFAGDLGQRIFQTPFSWKALGVDVRGRSRTLKVNYRTSHEIRSMADRLLGGEVADVDGEVEQRRGTISAFNGPEPVVQLFEDEKQEIERVGAWIDERLAAGVAAHEMGVFVRSEAELARAMTAVKQYGKGVARLDRHSEPEEGKVAVRLMHDAKGMEFRAVVVMACDDQVVPLQSRMEAISDAAELETTYETERHLLYVACTRARDYLFVTATKPGSEFLADMA